MGIKVKCRNCNKEADSDTFKLHYEYKMVVCPDCFRGKTKKQEEKEKVQIIKEKPVGWDVEDEYLQKYHRQKQKEKPQFKRVPGTNQIQCTCHQCSFSFKYDPFRKRPRTCPYCNENIPKMNTFSLL